MSGIRGKDTKPQLALRRALHARGFRYRIHDRSVPGHPDLVLPKYRAVILVHGCFWHLHQGCRYATLPKTRQELWQSKFAANTRRDREVLALLGYDGWRVATVWECSVMRPQRVEKTTDLVVSWLIGSDSTLEIGL